MDNEDVRAAVYAYLDGLGVAYRTASHPPAAGIGECAAVGERLGAVVCKNYFLTTKSRKHWCLCVVRPEARLRTADVSKQVGTPRLSFAGEDDLMEKLRVRPGSVSPMGLIFDSAAEVRVLVDSGLRALDALAFHPCDNTQTLAMASKDFFGVFLPAVGKAAEWVEIHDFMEA